MEIASSSWVRFRVRERDLSLSTNGSGNALVGGEAATTAVVVGAGAGLPVGIPAGCSQGTTAQARSIFAISFDRSEEDIPALEDEVAELLLLSSSGGCPLVSGTT